MLFLSLSNQGFTIFPVKERKINHKGVSTGMGSRLQTVIPNGIPVSDIYRQSAYDIGKMIMI
jgi:hypothetical protein